MLHSINHSYDSYITFPKLMINTYSGIIVLFLNKDEGTLLHNPNEIQKEPIGTHYKDSIWAMENFMDYHGTLQLKNKNI